MRIATDDDVRVQAAVQDELAWTPDVDAAGIGVAVEDGTVTLSGEVDSYAERVAARHAALRVRGVTAFVDNLTVHPKGASQVSETDIAKAVDHALKGASNIPDSVKAEINYHHVTLTGEVEWDYQRRAARRAVEHLRGVHTVNNMITLSARPTAPDAEERIRNALTRNALLDAQKITVTIAGNKVILGGTVRSWAEKQQAGRAVWSSPHVTDVDNRITVQAN